MSEVVTPYVLHLAAVDKYGLIGAAGYLLALRDMGYLQHCRVISSSGLGNLVVAMLARAVYQRGRRVKPGGAEQAWREITAPIFERSTSVDFLQTLVLRPLLAWCRSNQEWIMFRTRVCNWREIFSAWGHELSRLLEDEAGKVKASWRQIWEFNTRHADSVHVPVLCMTCARRGSPDVQALTTYYQSIQAARVQIIAGRIRDTDNFATWLSASMLWSDRFGSLQQRWGRQQARLMSVLELDPLGEEASLLFYHRLRLNRRPSGPHGQALAYTGGQLLLYDGITDSPWSCNISSHHVSTLMFGYHQRVTSGDTPTGDALRACRKMVATLYDSVPHADASDEDVKGLRDFLRQLYACTHGLSSVHTEMSMHALNLGYVQAYFAHGKANEGEIPYALPCQQVGDTYRFRHALYTKARWKRLVRQRRRINTTDAKLATSLHWSVSASDEEKDVNRAYVSRSDKASDVQQRLLDTVDRSAHGLQTLSSSRDEDVSEDADALLGADACSHADVSHSAPSQHRHTDFDDTKGRTCHLPSGASTSDVTLDVREPADVPSDVPTDGSSHLP